MVQAALVALGRLDQEHAMVYFQLIWNGLREPMRQALEASVMERQIEGEGIDNVHGAKTATGVLS
ncbi:hypothetical protein WME94_35325 [Sorangium sp. So ce429]